MVERQFLGNRFHLWFLKSKATMFTINLPEDETQLSVCENEPMAVRRDGIG